MRRPIIRKTLAAIGVQVALFSLLSGFTVASADTTPIEQYVDQGPAVKNVGGYTGVYVEDSSVITNQLSNLTSFYFDKVNGSWIPRESFTCKSFAEPNCAKAQNLWYTAVLNVCNSDSDSNCIVGVSAIKDGNEIVGTFAENYPASSDYVFKGDNSAHIPDGGLPSLWTFPGLTHQGGDKFLVFARFTHNGGWYNGETIDFKPDQFGAGIFGVSTKKNKSFSEFNVKTGKADELGKVAWWDGRGPNTGCVSNGPEGECAIAWPLPDNVRFKLKVRTNVPMSNFLHGRLLDPTISVKTDSSNQNTMTIEAGSVQVPILNTWIKNSDMPKALHDYLYSLQGWGGYFLYRDGKGDGRDNVQLLEPFNDYDAQSFNEYLWWLDVAQNKSVGSRSMWIVRTLSSLEIYRAGSKIRSCIESTGNISGIVTTDAGMYISGPPTFNEATQSLDYKVSAPHNDEKGNPNIGHYNLVLNADVARCVYGFSKAPISATVSVVSSDASEQIATTAVSERDGWLYLSAAGYGYSAPTIKVKLSQPTSAPVAATPVTQAPVVVQKVVKKMSITCVKGKTTKKISGTNPVCPAGYKKK
jgi:hypothetical protein